MERPQVNPLSEADYNKINQQLGELARLQQQIQQAALAGCEVGDKSSYCQQLMSQFQTLKQTYFADRP